MKKLWLHRYPETGKGRTELAAMDMKNSLTYHSGYHSYSSHVPCPPKRNALRWGLLSKY